MEYLALFLTLLFIELLYFKVAKKFNIIDKPNLRSSHEHLTLRGGGIIFYIAAASQFITSEFEFPWFFIGLTSMAVISFVDDVVSLSNKIRIFVHFAAVILIAVQLHVFSMPWYYIVIGFVVVVGVINAYNFMDGINGMTACYSLSVGALLLLVNYEVNFIESNFIIYPLIGVMVFAIFNFRTIAKTFAGDVGSVSIAFILMFCFAKLILKTGDYIYILFLTLYGLDTVWTIIRRFTLGESIFEAHRSHLYQYLGNEVGCSKLLISFLYAVLQFGIGLLVIWISQFDFSVQIVFSVVLLSVLSVVYLILKRMIIRKYIFKVL
ncbi:MraY family glycosyltransferase [Sphingobacterium hotanense]|uniref:UDP-GlcNAc--UDP-phosphate GlcNAc-1-phosphate transferase n=1 Tax=Sphingobacterium hotanense TaxID=649196 RepID=UPI0011F3E958|nr:UDP-GlcNAc--UDP-phosphate GlcNAc-1-phosphate transferase [Sphingobacterium hotanense]